MTIERDSEGVEGMDGETTEIIVWGRAQTLRISPNPEARFNGRLDCVLERSESLFKKKTSLLLSLT